MGVYGLTSFIDDHADILQDYELHDSKLVIDASNLYFFIYYNLNVRHLYGGDYDIFALRIRQVFQLFLACGIEPYVVFDGAYSRDDKKLETTIIRARKRISSSDSISRGHNGKLLPILAYDTFIIVLDQLNIHHVTCDLEADDQIVLLANQFQCPVLSGDSDFYIFDIVGGYIPTDYLTFEASESSDKTYRFLPCQFYHVDNFVKGFEGLTKDNLPLAATVLGNDFIDRDGFERFLAKLNMPKDLKKCASNQRYHKLIKLLHWLASLGDPDKAQEEIVKFLSPSQQTKMRELIQLSVKGYRNMRQDFDLAVFFQNPDTVVDPTDLKGYHGTDIPPWLIAKVRKAELPVFMINIITLHRTFLLCQIEHTQSPSAWNISNRLRAILYGILLKDDLETITGKREKLSKRDTMVEEYSRDVKNCQKTFLEPCTSLPEFGSLPGLVELPDLDEDSALSFLCESLSLEKTTLLSFPPHLSFYLGCVIVWVRDSIPKVTIHHLRALIVCLIYICVKRHSTREGSSSLPEAGNVSSSKTDLDLEVAVNSSSDKQLQVLKSNLERFSRRPSHNHNNVIDVTIIHGFSQLQALLVIANHLNRLLGKALMDANPEELFNGTFLYNLCQDLLNRPSPDKFLSEMLVRRSPLHQWFQNVEHFILSNLRPEEVPIATSKNPKQKKRPKRGTPKSHPKIHEESSAVHLDGLGDEKKGRLIEHTQSPSAWNISNRLRAILYGILLKDDLEMVTGKRQKLSKRDTMVEEYSRDVKNCQKTFLELCTSLPEFGSLPGLVELPDLDEDSALSFLCESLSLEKTTLLSFPPHLSFYLGCVIICEWVRDSIPKVTIHHLRALIVCLIYICVKRHSTREGSSSLPEAGNVSSSKTDLDLEVAVKSSSDKQLQVLKSNLERFSRRPYHNHKNVIDVTIIHGFSQLQALLVIANHLNRLVGKAVMDANPEELFNGTFLYNLCHDLLNRPSPDKFLSEMLVRGSPLHQWFQNVEHFILSNLRPEEVPIATSKKPKQKKRPKRGTPKSHPKIHEESSAVHLDGLVDEKKGRLVCEAACDLHNRFSLFAVEGDSD